MRRFDFGKLLMWAVWLCWSLEWWLVGVPTFRTKIKILESPQVAVQCQGVPCLEHNTALCDLAVSKEEIIDKWNLRNKSAWSFSKAKICQHDTYRLKGTRICIKKAKQRCTKMWCERFPKPLPAPPRSGGMHLRCDSTRLPRYPFGHIWQQ